MAESAEPNDAMDSESGPSIDPEEIRVKTHEGEPALELPNGQLIRLRTHVKIEDENLPFGRPVETKTEVDTDEFAWWIVYPTEDDDYPRVDIEPEVINGEDADE